MLKNYFKIAWRNLLRNKVSSLINVGGLAAGIAVAITIGLWISDELSFNQSFKNYDTIAQVYSTGSLDGKWKTSAYKPQPLAQELRTRYGSSFKHVVLSRQTQSHLITVNGQTITKSGRFMEAAAPEMLSLEMITGSRSALNDPSTVIIAASMAKALFGSSNPINKIVKIDNLTTAKVGGVYKDLPGNTEFGDLDFIAPWDLLLTTELWLARSKNDWQNTSVLIYVQIADNTSMDAVSKRIKKAIHNNSDEESKRFNSKTFLHPMNRWHLYSEWRNGVNTGGRIQFVWLFSITGAFVLLLACINFMNLSTAKSEKRAKEVGVRKAVGSARKQLVTQFLCESFLVSLLAFIVALGLVVITMPWFNHVAGKQMSVLWTNPYFWLASFIFIFLTSLLAGSYPAFYLSAFNPTKTLKGNLRFGGSGSLPRKVLVVVQFTISVALIIGTIVVYRQIQHAKNRPLGYDTGGLVGIRLASKNLRWNAKLLGDKLKANGIADEYALSNSPITEIWSRSGGFEWKGKAPDKLWNFGTFWVSHDFGKTVGWKIKEGRDFSRKFATDSTNESSKLGPVYSMIINEAAAEYMNLKHPVGELIRWDEGKLQIIGVVKNQVMDSPFSSSQPTVYLVNYDNATSWMYLKLNPALSVGDAISRLQLTYKSLVPDLPFSYSFVDMEYAEKFAMEERTGKLSTIFASLAILISCLGLLGLISYVAEQRKKEIGIRKVLGASVASLWRLLSWEFLLLVCISCLIAFPIAWHFLSGWLDGYEYRIGLSWWVFMLAAAGAISIALITVSYQALKAAMVNPIKSLRTE